jgi:Protein of unknown function (DUF3810)
MRQPLPDNRRTRWRVPAALGILALAVAILPLPATIVERIYSTRFYAVLQPRVTALSNTLRFSLLDAALLAAVAAWLGLAARDFTQGHAWRAAGQAIARTLAWASVGYLLFAIVWGLNYRRVRLVDALPFDRARVSEPAVVNAAALAVEQLNALHDPTRSDDLPLAAVIDQVPPGAMQDALADVGRHHRLVPGRPKTTILDLYFRRAGVDGMTDPFFLETLVATSLLPFERPMIAAHEWAHLAGIADEGEANFVAWLACLRASPAAQYSGWLFLYGELMQSVAARDRAAIASRLAAGPRADLRAIRDRLTRQISPRLSAVGWNMYDSYLKANRVEAGAASYGEVVRLVLGARLASGRDPLAR